MHNNDLLINAWALVQYDNDRVARRDAEWDAAMAEARAVKPLILHPWPPFPKSGIEVVEG